MRLQIVLAVAIAATVPVVAQGPIPASPAATRLAAWTGAVTTHTPGRDDAAVERLAQWTGSELSSMLRELRKRGSDLNDLLKRGAVLHADIAILRRSAAGYALPVESESALVISDGEYIGRTGRTVHWTFGRQLLDAVRPSPREDEDVRLWYRATSAFLQARHEYSELQPHLIRARAIFPLDAVLTLYAGTIHESYAEPRYQTAMLSIDPALRVLQSVGAEREQAEALFRQALDLDPALHEARVRLGRVVGRRARHEEGVTELGKALASPLPAQWEYYARLFLGQTQHTLGRRDGARAAFERAAALYPRAQSPRLAMSQLAREAGDLPAAIAALAVLTLPANTMARWDPWTEYTSAHAPDVDELLTTLRSRWRQ